MKPSTRSPARIAFPATALLVAALFASPATADWLVLEDGERIQTRGPWKVQGDRVLFKTSSGALTSIRSSEVDLAASREASAPQDAVAPERSRPAPSGALAARRSRGAEPVLVLAQKDIGKARAPQPEAEVSEEEAEEAVENVGLEIESWNEINGNIDGLAFSGIVRNPTENFAVLVEVHATLFDTEGRRLARAQAALPAASVGPGETQSFAVSFPNQFSYGEILFESDAKMLLAGPQEQAAEESSDRPSEDDAETPSATSDS